MDTLQSENTKTKFNSPIPMLVQLRDVVFGKEKPDGYTQATFYLNISIWFILFIWSIISYFVISLRDLIYTEKSIPVETIILERGEQIGFESTDFLDRLLTFHSISIVCWILVFIGLVLLWRKNLRFVYFFFGGTMSYFAMVLFYLNSTYFVEDVTFFDKIAFLAMNASALLYFFLLKREIQGGTLSFFGEDQDDE